MMRAAVAEGKGRQGGPLFLPTSLRLPRTHLLSVNQHRCTLAHTHASNRGALCIREGVAQARSSNGDERTRSCGVRLHEIYLHVCMYYIFIGKE